MSVATNSPFLHSSPGSFSLLLESRGNQRVPGSPSLSPASLYGTTSLQRRLTERLGGSPAGQTVPEAVNVPRSGEQAVYSGSPLLRQILRSGRKRQREDCSPSSPSPIAVSSKRHCQDVSRVPTSLVVLNRSAVSKQTNGASAQSLQVVPESSHTHEQLAPKPSQACGSTEQGTSKELSDSGTDLKWFDLFISGSLSGTDVLTQREE